MPLETTPFDAAAYLGSKEAQAEFLADAFDAGDSRYVVHALSVIARARGMSQLAEETGMARTQLYRALGDEGNPTIETISKIAGALGLKLALVSA